MPSDKIFVGMMHTPFKKLNPNGAGVVVCPLGHHNLTREGLSSCWQLGHFDYPIYKEVKEDGTQEK